jgi:hypothetical protein
MSKKFQKIKTWWSRTVSSRLGNISNIGSRFILAQSGFSPEESEEIRNIGYDNVEVTKALIDKALQAKTEKILDIDVESEEFHREIEKRVFIKNIKHWLFFL